MCCSAIFPSLPLSPSPSPSLLYGVPFYPLIPAITRLTLQRERGRELRNAVCVLADTGLNNRILIRLLTVVSRKRIIKNMRVLRVSHQTIPLSHSALLH